MDNPPAAGSPSGDRAAQTMLQFAAGAAHEIAGPIEQIASLVAFFVRRYRGKVDDEADAMLAMIEKAGARLAGTANGLRKCLQTVTLGPKSPIDLNAAVDAALLPLARQIADSSASIETGPLPVVEGDRTLLVSLFQALVENSLKFRVDNSRPHIVISGQQSANGHQIEVSDNGIGIDPQYSELVFAPFKRLNGHAYPGAGLGLTLARMVVDLHGGRIWIEPATTGTRVRFELP